MDIKYSEYVECILSNIDFRAVKIKNIVVEKLDVN